MNVRRLIFLLLFGAYHLAAFIFTLIVEYRDGYIYTLLGKVHLFKYGTLLGLVLFIVEFIWVQRESKNNK